MQKGFQALPLLGGEIDRVAPQVFLNGLPDMRGRFALVPLQPVQQREVFFGHAGSVHRNGTAAKPPPLLEQVASTWWVACCSSLLRGRVYAN